MNVEGNARGNASVTSTVSVTETGVESVTRIGIRKEGELIHHIESAFCQVNLLSGSGAPFIYPTRKVTSSAKGINQWNVRGGDRPADLLTLQASISPVSPARNRNRKRLHHHRKSGAHSSAVRPRPLRSPVSFPAGVGTSCPSSPETGGLRKITNLLYYRMTDIAAHSAIRTASYPAS